MPVTFSGAVLSGTSLFSVTEGFSPYSLFASGEQGAWYDPSDMSTMFEDSAGNVRVTNVERPVGRILDKSGRGNHATQSSDASRPVLSARYNLLTKTEQFNDAAWTKSNMTASADQETAPDGTATADKLVETAATNAHYFNQSVSAGAARTYLLSLYIKPLNKQYVAVNMNNATNSGIGPVFDLTNGTVVGNIVLGSGWSVISSSITASQNGFYKLVAEISAPSATNHVVEIVARSSNGLSWADSYAGNTNNGYYIWGADLRVSNDGVGLPAYQRVNTSTDYDTNGFPMYLRFDGTDDSLATGSVDFSSSDKMTVWAGVRKLSDAAIGVIAELSATTQSNAGSFYLSGPDTVAANYGMRVGGSLRPASGQFTTYTAPLTNLLTGVFDIAGDSRIARINATQVNSDVSDQGIGNFGNYPLNIGRRNNATLPFNGRLYSLIVRGASSSAGQISDTEAWVNGKTKAYA